jgi:hypothetical protein
MSATKKIPAKTRGVKATVKVGKVNRTAQKPELTDAEIDAAVQRALADESLLSRTNSLVVDTLSALGSGVLTVIETIADAIKRIASGVWSFLGRVYNAFEEAVTALVGWLKETATAAYGQAKKALTAVHELVSSMNVSDINAGMLKLVAAAAAIGVGFTVGGVVGITAAAVAAKLGAANIVIQATGVLFAASTTLCTSSALYALFEGGVEKSTLARILPAVEAKVKAMRGGKAAVAAA